MKTLVRLNLYERGIVESLVTDFKFVPTAARDVVVEYIDVVRKLGAYDNCEVHAERLVRAKKLGYSPEAWLERIHSLRREALHDRGIETPTEIAYVR
jgi:hypothetical protein